MPWSIISRTNHGSVVRSRSGKIRSTSTSSIPATAVSMPTRQVVVPSQPSWWTVAVRSRSASASRRISTTASDRCGASGATIPIVAPSRSPLAAAVLTASRRLVRSPDSRERRRPPERSRSRSEIPRVAMKEVRLVRVRQGAVVPGTASTASTTTARWTSTASRQAASLSVSMSNPPPPRAETSTVRRSNRLP